MSKTKKFIIVCLIIAGFGFFLTGLGSALGGRVTGIGFGSNGFEVTTPRYPLGLNNEPSGQEEKELALEAFDGIIVDAAYSDVSIIPSDHFGIAYRTDKIRIPTWDIQDGCLTVSQKNSRDHHGYGANWYLFNFNFGINTVSYEDYYKEYIDIYIPDGTSLKQVDIHTESGKVTIDGIDSVTLVLNNGYGDMQLSQITAQELKVIMESGDLDIQVVSADTAAIRNSYGSLDVKQLSVTGQADMIMESGDLTMEKSSFGSLSVNNSYGSISGYAISSPDISLWLGSGTCRISDLSVDTLKIDSRYGEAALSLTSPLSDYNLDLDTAYGDISLDGRKRENGRYTSAIGSARQIEIICESGNISVNGAKQ